MQRRDFALWISYRQDKDVHSEAELHSRLSALQIHGEAEEFAPQVWRVSGIGGL